MSSDDNNSNKKGEKNPNPEKERGKKHRETVGQLTGDTETSKNKFLNKNKFIYGGFFSR